LAAVWALRALLALTVLDQPTPGLSPRCWWPKTPFQLSLRPSDPSWAMSQVAILNCLDFAEWSTAWLDLSACPC